MEHQKDDFESDDEIGWLKNWMLKSDDNPIEREMIESQSDDN